MSDSTIWKTHVLPNDVEIVSVVWWEVSDQKWKVRMYLPAEDSISFAIVSELVHDDLRFFGEMLQRWWGKAGHGPRLKEIPFPLWRSSELTALAYTTRDWAEKHLEAEVAKLRRALHYDELTTFVARVLCADGGHEWSDNEVMRRTWLARARSAIALAKMDGAKLPGGNDGD